MISFLLGFVLGGIFGTMMMALFIGGSGRRK